MDYLEQAMVVRDASWDAFRAATAGRRLVLLSTGASLPYTAFAFSTADILLLGRESAGVPAMVHEAADARLRIPMRHGLRSLNVALACAMVTGEALRQTGSFPTASA
jgi:tRNA (cytidine/uridine-2'-O-)-methyltransferase